MVRVNCCSAYLSLLAVLSNCSFCLRQSTLGIYIYYKSKENIKESSRKFEQAAREHADGELCHDETLLRKCLCLAIWRQLASDGDP